jgi:hypothetical protein
LLPSSPPARRSLKTKLKTNGANRRRRHPVNFYQFPTKKQPPQNLRSPQLFVSVCAKRAVGVAAGGGVCVGVKKNFREYAISGGGGRLYCMIIFDRLTLKLEKEETWSWVLHVNPEYFGLLRGFINCIVIRCGKVFYYDGKLNTPMPDFRTAANRLIEDTVKATLLPYAKS